MKNFSRVFFVLTLLLLLGVTTSCSRAPAFEYTVDPPPDVIDVDVFYSDLANRVTAENAPLDDALEIYKRLKEVYPGNHEYRIAVLDYIMAESLKLVQSQKKADVDRGLEFAYKLNEVNPGDFYAQNRLFEAYIFYSKAEMKWRNWDKADEWALKGLKIRFDIEAMRTHLKILIARAEEEIDSGEFDTARAHLGEALEIMSIADNVTLYISEKNEAEKLLIEIQ